MKYNEDEILKECLTYIKETYGEHYADKNNHQLMDDIMADGDDLAFNKWNAIKYLRRYGRKNGYNKKDLLKAVHYTVLMLYNAQIGEE